MPLPEVLHYGECVQLSRRARLLASQLFLDERADFLQGSSGGNSVFLSQDVDRAMLDKLVWPANSYHGSRDVILREMFHDGAAEPIVENVILDGADYINAPGKELQSAGV
jgi:hypothetical protein